MAARMFVDLVSGVLTRISAAVVGGGGSANAIVGTNASGLIDDSFFPAGIGADQVTAITSENIAANDMVNIYSNAGTITIRKADASAATASKKATHFALAAITSGQTGTVYQAGHNTGMTGVTVGDLWLSGATPGAVTPTPPSITGYCVQRVGIGLTTTSMDVAINTAPVVL